MTTEMIGKMVLEKICNDASDGLHQFVKREFEPYAGVYRINDFGEYVSENDFINYWNAFPDWHVKAWMLSDNGQYTFDEVAAMTVQEIEAAYNDPYFEPEYVFYTELEEDGLLFH